MEKVVLLDDHKVVLKGIRSILEETGMFSVTGESDNIDEGVKLIRDNIPEFLIVDIELGGNSGALDFITNVHDEFPDILILVMSMYDDAFYAEKAVKAGAKGFISKIDLADNIFEAINTIKSGRLYLSDEICNIIAGNHFRNYLNPPASGILNLTNRELEVFNLIGRGLKRNEIAAKMNISVRTVEVYRRRIRIKLSISDSSSLEKAAMKHVSEKLSIHT